MSVESDEIVVFANKEIDIRLTSSLLMPNIVKPNFHSTANRNKKGTRKILKFDIC